MTEKAVDRNGDIRSRDEEDDVDGDVGEKEDDDELADDGDHDPTERRDELAAKASSQISSALSEY